MLHLLGLGRIMNDTRILAYRSRSIYTMLCLQIY